jgi:hypothetical protein
LNVKRCGNERKEAFGFNVAKSPALYCKPLSIFEVVTSLDRTTLRRLPAMTGCFARVAWASSPRREGAAFPVVAAISSASTRSAEASLLIHTDPLRSAWWVTQGGRNAFNRDRSYCCRRPFAGDRVTDSIGAGERGGHRSSRGRYGIGNPSALLVHVARLARLLPSLALRVREFPISI